MLLIHDYLELAKVCASTDYADKKSVKVHNLSVRKMYAIAEKIGNGKVSETVDDFTTLLDVSDYKTNVWAAIHLLDCIPVDKMMEEKALNIIQQQANGVLADAMGYKIWLDNYRQSKSQI